MNEIEVMSELAIDGRPMGIINSTAVSTGEIAQSSQVRDVVREISRWVDETRGRGQAQSSMFRRDRFVPANNPYALMKAAKDAVDTDDIVSGVLESTSALAFPGCKWEGDNADEADIFNQINADLNMDAFLRNAYRDWFRYDQFVAAKLWGYGEYTVRGKTKNGNKRKKTYRVWAPQRLVILDSMLTVPIGRGPLREDRLAWAGSEAEIVHYQDVFEGDTIDPLMTLFFQGTYTPTEVEVRDMVAWGVDPQQLLVMNSDYVFRHTGDRADHELFPQTKLKSVFSLLDLKQQLMASDRATLIGAANYILLIRQGTDVKPGTPDEIANLKQNYNFLAKLPVIISDHRLQIDIVAPKMDFVLNQAHYETLDHRILARLIGAMSVGANREPTGRNTTGALVERVVANRRHMIARTIEREIGHAVVNHPKNAGIFQDEAPSLVYTPRNVSIETDQAYLAALLALRTQREVSRETTLEYLGLDEGAEAQRVQVEAEQYDDIFKTVVPFSATGNGDANAAKPTDPNAPDAPAPAAEAPAVSGKRGGRPAGGGTSPQSPAAQSKPKTANGNPSTRSN